MTRAKKGHFNDLCSIVVVHVQQQTYQNVGILVVVHDASDRTRQEAQVNDKRGKSSERWQERI